MIGKGKAGSVCIGGPVTLRRSQQWREEPQRQLWRVTPKQRVGSVGQAEFVFKVTKRLPQRLKQECHGFQQVSLQGGAQRSQLLGQRDTGKNGRIIDGVQTCRCERDRGPSNSCSAGQKKCRERGC
jgi:hypothetical protein